MTLSPVLRRQLAGTLALSLLFIPFTASALLPKEEETATAVSAPSPLSLRPDPAATYRAAEQLLSPLALDQSQVNTLWGRFGTQLLDELEQDNLSPQALLYLSLPYSDPDLLDRYLAYGQADPSRSAQQVVTQVNIGLDRDFYTDTELIQDPADPLVLVNKYDFLPQSYVPEVERLGSRYGTGSLTPEAAAQFRAMADAALADGISLRSVSAYRSYSTQASLYQNYVRRHGQSQADTFSARPGYSEHQTGLAVDINTASISAHFEDTPEYAWLQEHCTEYGFLLRYPQDGEAITGYTFEPWHYRYVGTEVAQFCTQQGLTLEEYLAQQSVPGPYQAPDLSYQGETLDLDQGALILDDTLYLSVSQLAFALGWQVAQVQDGLTLTDGQHTLTFTAGRRFLRDGVSFPLTASAVALHGDFYLSLSDLCIALRLGWVRGDDRVDLIPQPSAAPIEART
jgi:LAS superfamily LD-carboxypeptidase LdcB